MALFVFPLKSINGSNMYNNDDFRQYFANFISTGILANAPLAGSTAFQVTQTDNPSMNVIVGSGVAWIIGGQVMNTSSLSFQIPAPLTSQSRTDSIVVQWSNSNNNGDIIYKQNSTQVVQTNDVYELQLCKILVPANATNISQANITDMRADTSVCGFSSPYEAIKTGDLLAQFKSELEANGVLFEDWFENIKGQLSEDAAGNLQNEINNLTSIKADNEKVVHNTGDEDIAGKKNFTDDMKTKNLEVSGKLELPTATLTVTTKSGLVLILNKLGDLAEVSFSGEVSNVTPGKMIPGTWVDNPFHPTTTKQLIGHFAGRDTSFHIDLKPDGSMIWWGAAIGTASLTARGTSTYLLN